MVQPSPTRAESVRSSAARWTQIVARASKEVALKAGRITDIETPDRIRNRLEHLTAASLDSQTRRPNP
jgi:hypothetical protein